VAPIDGVDAEKPAAEIQRSEDGSGASPGTKQAGRDGEGHRARHPRVRRQQSRARSSSAPPSKIIWTRRRVEQPRQRHRSRGNSANQNSRERKPTASSRNTPGASETTPAAWSRVKASVETTAAPEPASQNARIRNLRRGCPTRANTNPKFLRSAQRTGVQLRAPEGAQSATDKPVCCNALLGGGASTVHGSSSTIPGGSRLRQLRRQARTSCTGRPT
jgi:hypothetical protein